MLIVTLLLFSVLTSYGMTEQEQANFTALMKRSDNFFVLPGAQPVKDLPNRIHTIVGNDQKKQKQVVWQAQNTKPIFHPKVLSLIDDFLELKKINGHNIEQTVYKNMQQGEYIKGLYTKRPLVFMTKNDYCVLKDGTNYDIADTAFDKIGTTQETEPFLLTDYISYDDMQISALCGVAVPTFFINNGNRKNGARPSEFDDYEQEGIYMGLVGARFERANRMECQHMLITKEHSTRENGYGENNNSTTMQALLLQIWAKFYEIPFFPTYEQAKKDSVGRYLRINNKNLSDHPIYLDMHIYKKRMFLSIVTFLYAANKRGKEEEKRAYCHAVGLGLGVWSIDDRQAEFMLDVYHDIISQNNFKHISDINFSWFPNGSETYWNKKPSLKNINIIFSRRNPADKLIGNDQGKLLVAMYAWDGNSYPGNEYWCPALSASGDPAAACCSTIAELQNPDINEDMINNIQPTIEYITQSTQYPSFDNLVFTYKERSFLDLVTQNLLFIGSILIIPLLLYCYKKGILTKH